MASEPFHPSVDELVAHNEAARATSDHVDLAAAPERRLAVVACMDARLDVLEILGLSAGEAHIVRNAGGVVTDDVIRSLCLSQRHLGTREVILLHHTDCGLEGVDEAAFKAELESELGVAPDWALESFQDPHADVRRSVQRLVDSPFVAHADHISGFVYDVATGVLHRVGADGAEAPRD